MSACPWGELTRETFGWGDYEAWVSWMDEQMGLNGTCSCGGECSRCIAAKGWEGIDIHTRIHIYAAMCKVLAGEPAPEAK